MSRGDVIRSEDDTYEQEQQIHETFEKHNGVFRLIPVFVPRRFGQAGRGLRLHPHDYYALGTQRGSIKERWFSSVIPAMNGDLAAPDEGMSYVAASDDAADRFLLKDAVDELGADLIGAGADGAIRHVAHVFQVLRLLDAAFPPPASHRRRRRPSRADGQAGSVLFSAPAEQLRLVSCRSPTSATTRM